MGLRATFTKRVWERRRLAGVSYSFRTPDSPARRRRSWARCAARFLAVLALAASWLASTLPSAAAIAPPTGLVSRTGDQSIVLHWDRHSAKNLLGYRAYKARTASGTFVPVQAGLLTSSSLCDLNVTNEQSWFYRVTALTASGESAPSPSLCATAHPFQNDDEFLDYLQRTGFDFFWYEANPLNGLIPDRTSKDSPCSIAAVGFGLTAIAIGIEHGWITRAEGVRRVTKTLETFLRKPQGISASKNIGYRGWFYHFLDMKTALRFTRFNTELSSIDTALLLAGMLYAKEYFNGTGQEENSIRVIVDSIINRVDWQWMANGRDILSMGWLPDTDFLSSKWIGYNEAMLLYCLGLGVATNPLPASAWAGWTSGYRWATNCEMPFLSFAPLFGHQYSHCWIDFRNIADDFMREKGITYFENSRRATLAQRAYCMAKPKFQLAGPGVLWGLTASDGPTGYLAHGAPPPENDDGTIAPTAVAGSIPFTPEFSVPTLRGLYERYRPKIWTAYGFRDAFNLGLNWWGPDVLGIDVGPVVIMIENYRSQGVWKTFMRNEIVRRGLQRAGFLPVQSAQSKS